MTKPASEPAVSPDLRKQLSDEACLAAQSAYAPYSKFRVGAAVLGSSGAIYRGANVENACYGLGTCAERVALAAAKVAGEKDLSAIAIACVDTPPDAPVHRSLPCGACRQWLKELAPNAQIFIAGRTDSFFIDELLPRAFILDR